ncbi:Acetyl-coenzyme A synthetase [Mycolicibacterium vanbaalenii]|uniref:Acetyl-coenzyme A synthetase n=2 Tax=Mycolicibacterium vanbaalenii TaxID=110539 RepID=A0A5S9QM81_MYCVN|nr:Acetyl-coenzyme A synthetase [Mycolicibacterium vanbaalenii]
MTYRQAWHWSVSEPSDFWAAVREYFDVIGDDLDGPALAVDTMPGAVWFPGARLNFAENVLRHASTPSIADRPAIITLTEANEETQISWRELEARVAAVAGAFRDLGIGPGDSVAAVLPNIPEAIVALLATAAVGALWTISSPELSERATLDRLSQVKPKLLIGAAAYRFGGRDIQCRTALDGLRSLLPSVQLAVLVGGDPTDVAGPGSSWIDFRSLTAHVVPTRYERVAFEHPLWVLFTSGTTGLPKGVVHGHGGITLEALKSGALNHDIGVDDICYVAANTSWMVWNVLLCNMACGASVVTYSGSPIYPGVDRQFEILARTRATKFATGAAYLTRVQQQMTTPPKDTWDLSALTQILSTGSPLPASTWEWVHENVKRRVQLGSSSGGTEICSSFIGLNPLDPVYLGELQGPALGAAVESWNPLGEPVVGEVGEMVIRRPMPSMPIRFLDDDGTRYRAAYFEQFPGVWTHGDWITETSRNGFIVHGRSDATLNRAGVRFGSSDIYNALDDVPEVLDALVVGVESATAGGYYMPLFVVLAPDQDLDDSLRERIRTTIRRHASPRHIPDEIIQVPAVPVTHTGKKAEVPVKRILQTPPGLTASVSRNSLADPDAVDWYIAFSRRRAID